MADLVERAREHLGRPETRQLMNELADRIAALEAEVSKGERRGLERAAEVADCYINTKAFSRDQRASSDTALLIRNEIRALIPEAPAREGWQPIETAPKDGTVVWVWCPAYEDLGSLTSLASWHEDAGWCVDELRAPTMWRPLQAPPPPSQDREPDSQRGAK